MGDRVVIYRDDEITKEMMAAIAKNHQCDECESGLTVAWGGSFGYNGHILRCASNIEHKGYERIPYRTIEGGKKMPIKGLSERRRLPRLGKIHLGVKKKNAAGVEYPSAVDYFVCPEEVIAVFGEKPKELRILIPVEDEERWASQYYRCYSKTRGLICKGDGETCFRMVDLNTGDLAWKDDSKEVAMKEMTCPGRDCPDYGNKCKEVMNLQFLLPEVPGLGVWQIDTSSINSIRNINTTSELIKQLYGRVAMIPLLLTVEPQEVQPPDGKKKTVYILNLRTKDTLKQIAGIDPKKVLLIEEFAPEEMVELPNSEDEVPEMIIPGNQAPPGEEPLAEQADKSLVSLLWLRTSLELLQGKGLKVWSNINVVEHLNNVTGKRAKSVKEAVSYLNEEQAAVFVKKVEDTIAMS